MSDPTPNFTRLPDYPALQQLARALWHDRSVRGASVLVGAGLSKNATRASEDTLEPPLWWELLSEMRAQLYPHNQAAAPSDPLRVAEEFRTYYGQAGLDDFIRARFPDRSWTPGPLHADLLELPWTDVLTTNWDTLLERAAENSMDHSYDIVRTEADLTRARSPRIVKLHGSIDGDEPLIFAQDDYRTYPTKFAAFVNFARQVFIENELCLVGFSGDDPNFLEWAGWVRDHLGGSARRIYLVGNLGLEQATRRYFEAHNIIPIDLAPLLSHLPRKDQHGQGTRIFIDAMKSAKPAPASEWKITPAHQFPLHSVVPGAQQRAHTDPAFAAALLESTIPFLKADRQLYPGWLVCPFQHRKSLSYSVGESTLLRKQVRDLVDPKTLADAVYEFLWRRTTAFAALDPHLVEAIKELVDGFPPDVDSSMRPRFAVALMREARLARDDAALAHWQGIIEADPASNAPILQEALYQICLRYRDRMDLSRLADALVRLNLEDPIWKLRRAALHTEICDFSAASKLIKDSTAALERAFRLDRNSLPCKSRLAWADCVSRAIAIGNFQPRASSGRPRDFRQLEIDPLGEIEWIETQALEIEKKRREEEAVIQPAFDAGRYREGSRTVYIGGEPPGPALLYELDQLTEASGLPLRINNVTLCTSPALAAIGVIRDSTLELFVWILRALGSHYDRQFGRHFSRLSIAQLDGELVEGVISTVEKAVDFLCHRYRNSQDTEHKEDRSRALDFLRLQVTVLSRFSVRMSETIAIRTFHRVVDLVADPLLRHPWLLEAFADLARYAIEAISPPRRGSLALPIVELPLPSGNGHDDRWWSQLITAIWESPPFRETNDFRWGNRINQLIKAAQKDSKTRKEAIYRLSYLCKHHALTLDEESAFGAVLWSDLDAESPSLPANIGLIGVMCAQLPSIPGVDARERVRARLFNTDMSILLSRPLAVDTRILAAKTEQLMSLVNMVDLGFVPPSAIATRIFDQAVIWIAEEPEGIDLFQTIRGFNDKTRQLLGNLLSLALIPYMGVDDLTEGRVRALLAFIWRAGAWAGIAGLPYFAKCVPALSDDIHSAIHTALTSNDSHHVGGGAAAVETWGRLVGDGQLSEVPRPLVEQMIHGIETRHEVRLLPLLKAAQMLLGWKLLTAEDLIRLKKALEIIRGEFQYAGVESESMRAVCVSLVRAQCVKLASAIVTSTGSDDASLQAWFDEAQRDPLPEVRFSKGY